MYEIDNNIEFVQAKKARHSKVMDLPFAQLQPGQSFHVPTEEASHKAEAAKMSAWLRIAQSKTGAQYRLRSVGIEDPRGPGLRVWRVETLDDLFEGTDADATNTAEIAADIEPEQNQTEPEPEPVVVAKPKRVRKKKSDENKES